MTEFIEVYEKQYKKIKQLNRLAFIIWLLIVVAFFAAIIFSEMNIMWFVLAFAIFSIYGVKTLKQAYMDNVNTIVYKWQDDFDVDFALTVFRNLVQDRKRKDYVFLLSAYLNLLVIMCQFDEFEKVYRENEKLIQESFYPILPFYREMFLSMAEERSEFKEVILQYKFSRYHNVEKELKGNAAALRKRDEQHMVQQLYEMKDYQGLLDYLKHIHKQTKYDHILYATYRQRCLYYLDQNHEILVPEAPEFFCIRNLEHLRDTGEPYYFDRAKEFADRFKEDIQKGKRFWNKLTKRVMVCLVLFGFIISFCIPVLTNMISNTKEPVDEMEQIFSEYDFEEYENDEPEPVVEYEVGNNIFDNSNGSMYAFIDENTGWILNVNSAAAGSRWYDLSYTTDGGKDWIMINQDPFDGSGGVVEGIAFYDEKYGYIAISGASESHSRLFRTENGGYTFEEVLLPFEQCEEIENIEEYLYHYMPEVDGENVEVVVKCMKDNIDPGLVFQSEDAGKNWKYTGMTQ